MRRLSPEPPRIGLAYCITTDDNAPRCIVPTPTFEFRPPQTGSRENLIWRLTEKRT